MFENNDFLLRREKAVDVLWSSKANGDVGTWGSGTCWVKVSLKPTEAFSTNKHLGHLIVGSRHIRRTTLDFQTRMHNLIFNFYFNNILK